MRSDRGSVVRQAGNFIQKYEKKLRSDQGSDQNMRSDRGSVLRQDRSLDKGVGYLGEELHNNEAFFKEKKEYEKGLRYFKCLLS